MKLTTEIEIQCGVRANLSEDGQFSLKVSGAAVYDKETGATTTAQFPVPEAEAKAVRDALEAAMKAAVVEANHPRMHDAVHISRTVAKSLGEIK